MLKLSAMGSGLRRSKKVAVAVRVSAEAIRYGKRIETSLGDEAVRYDFGAEAIRYGKRIETQRLRVVRSTFVEC